MREFDYEGEEFAVRPNGKTDDGQEQYLIEAYGDETVLSRDPGDFRSMSELYSSVVEESAEALEPDEESPFASDEIETLI